MIELLCDKIEWVPCSLLLAVTHYSLKSNQKQADMGRLAAEREASAAEVVELRKEVSILFITCLGGQSALCCWWLCSSTAAATAALFNTTHIYT